MRSAAFDRATGFVAHHGARYLGDLDGGQWLGAAVLEVYRFRREGYRFFVFEGVDPELFPACYYRQLDATPWCRAEQHAFLAEVTAAGQLSVNLLTDLADRWL
ncbi:heme oxygenase [Actinoplanes sp. SE50]|nr:Heme oxygenase [Actinoplanes sp. SE50/110]ATO80014.1 heme oxygenase [Actinoplanes sp. SE50]SLL97418.1 Heme oxygenase [Actinoplanes sp. SE50/110]